MDDNTTTPEEPGRCGASVGVYETLQRRAARWGEAALSRLKLHRCELVGESPSVAGRVWVHGRGRVRLGNGVEIDGREAPVELHAHPGAEIRIGDDVRIGPGASLEAVELISLGSGVEIGSFSKVLDSHHHVLQRKMSGGGAESSSGDSRPPPDPVIVGDGAVIGARAILLPGAHVRACRHVPERAAVSRRGRPARSATGSTTAAAPPRRAGRTLRKLLALYARRAFQIVLAWLFLGRAAVGRRVFVSGRIRVDNRGSLVIGPEVQMLGGMITSEVICRRGATLSIGEYSLINYGVSIEATQSVRIGARCLVGSFVRISDGTPAGPRPVSIGDDVWIAHGAVLPPGVSIGDRSVVGAGSVVTQDVPPDHLALGNPARLLPLRLFGTEEP